ncbi:30S ribosomal protein S17 [Candidatus Curtissbacteria bacterium]|nr:30S ribosomal protein S17 [Candidatus Curtissbacteria bacterium]
MPQIRVGKVIGTKMQKTIIVEIMGVTKHPLYKKQIKRTTRLKVHDELGVKVGQKVKIQETRPISKDVHFKTLEVVS